MIKIYLEAIRLDEIGEWEASHQLIQQHNTVTACWIHAYLHRKEGDSWNANYWYERAGRKPSDQNLEKERDLIKTFVTSRIRST